MTHTHYQELTSQFIDRELGADDERGLFAHLGTCDECRGFLKSALLLQGDILGTKPAQSVPTGSVRPAHALRAVWRKRVPMSVAAMLAVLALASTLAMSALWMRPKEKVVETKEEIVYVPRMPAIQVIGYYPTSGSATK
jgi:predicted anti-sigma-YlaC factor YlaD